MHPNPRACAQQQSRVRRRADQSDAFAFFNLLRGKINLSQFLCVSQFLSQFLGPSFWSNSPTRRFCTSGGTTCYASMFRDFDKGT